LGVVPWTTHATIRLLCEGTSVGKNAYIAAGAIAAMGAAFLMALQQDRQASAQEAAIQTQLDQQAEQASQANRVRRENQIQIQTDRRLSPRTSRIFRASHLVGLNVRGKTGEDEIGEINDLVIGDDGRVAYVAVSFGGFLGLGDKLFAVPFESIELVREGDDPADLYARVDVTEEQLKTRQGFNQDKWPTDADESFKRSTERSPRQVERPLPNKSNVQRQQ
jgi:hypothetical protein